MIEDRLNAIGMANRGRKFLQERLRAQALSAVCRRLGMLFVKRMCGFSVLATSLRAVHQRA
jgi:hypothetical protein